MSADPKMLTCAIERTSGYLLSQQHQEGYWVGELESDISVTAGYIPFMRYLGIEPGARTHKVDRLLVATQLPDGGWPSYAGGPGNLDVSIQVYLALKLLGHAADEPLMERARALILDRGGIARAHTFTKILLALFGQFEWNRLPTVPPEIVLLPRRGPLTIYDFSSWARATIVALSVVFAHRPVHTLPPSQGVWELHRVGADQSANGRAGLLSYEWGFLLLDRVLRAYERLGWKPGRERALQAAEAWVVAHQDVDGSWGGIMLPWLYSLVALRCLGYTDQRPAMARGLAGLEDFILEDETTMRLQPAVSPVWDTAYALLALCDAGLPSDHEALVRGAGWLLGKQILAGGDWQVKRPRAAAGGWPFELANDSYPDVDDTAMVPLALLGVQTGDEMCKARAIGRAVDWLLAMQSRSGGWAAFDIDNDKQVLAHIPFADFVTPLDPPSADVTAHVVELLARLGHDPAAPPLSRALAYLRGQQEENGAWFGRWGVNYVYGTAAALMGLRAAGEGTQSDAVSRAVRWLLAHQNADGGWGETCATYEDPVLAGSGPSTASQTAWAVLGLLAGDAADQPATVAGIDYLVETQSSDGCWDEESFTGTGFPGAFYLRYHMYPVYFPLMALARYGRATGALKDDER